MAKAVVAVGAMIVSSCLVACGGNSKPPMTPDPDVNMIPDTADLDANAPAQPQPSAAPAPSK